MLALGKTVEGWAIQKRRLKRSDNWKQVKTVKTLNHTGDATDPEEPPPQKKPGVKKAPKK